MPIRCTSSVLYFRPAVEGLCTSQRCLLMEEVSLGRSVCAQRGDDGEETLSFSTRAATTQRGWQQILTSGSGGSMGGVSFDSAAPPRCGFKIVDVRLLFGRSEESLQSDIRSLRRSLSGHAAIESAARNVSNYDSVSFTTAVALLDAAEVVAIEPIAFSTQEPDPGRR